MKKLFYILIFAIAFTLGSYQFAFGQSEISLPRETAEKALRAIEILPKLEAENSALRKQVAELESAKLTPCSVAIQNAEKLIVALPFGEPNDTKAMVKARKEQRKLIKMLIVNTVKSECKWQPSNSFWKELLKIAPIAAAVLLK